MHMGNNSSSSSAFDGDGGGGGSTSTIAAETDTGSHVIKVKEFSQTRGVLGAGKFIESASFSVGGHSWFIHYYPDGLDATHGDGWAGVVLLDLYLRPPLRRPDSGADDDVVVKAWFKLSLLGHDGKPVAGHVLAPPETQTFSATQGYGYGYSPFHRNGTEFGFSRYLKDDSFSVRCEITVITAVRAVAARNNKFVEVPPPSLQRDLGGLLSEATGADVTFAVGAGELFPAHRSLLAARSPVFKAELLGPMREKMADRVQVADMEPGVFRAMLHFIYTDSLPAAAAAIGGGGGEETTTAIMAQHLLVAADRYDIKRLRLICEDTLCDRISKDTVATTLVLAEQHGCHGLKEACVAFLASRDNLEAAMATDGYEHLRSSCPLLHDQLVAKVAPHHVFNDSTNVRKLLPCF